VTSKYRASLTILGLVQTERMGRTITQQRYVLTPDFALKLLILNERRKVHQNVILSGNTGIGKTELMSLFSLVINSDSELLPDILFETSDFIFRSIIHDNTKPGYVLRHPKFAQYVRGKSPNYECKVKVMF
jgi:predicted ATPase